MKLNAKVEVLDKDICQKCRFLHVENHPTMVFGDGQVVSIDNNYQCSDVHKCRYLRNLFESAVETTPVVEDVNPQ